METVAPDSEYLSMYLLDNGISPPHCLNMVETISTCHVNPRGGESSGIGISPKGR